MNYSLIYSLVNLVIYIPIVYYSYKIVRNISENEDAASAMFFLRKSSRKTFRYAAILVTFVLAGEILVFARFYYSDLVMALGYILLIVANIGVLYFVKGVSKVTVSPSEAEQRGL